MDLGTESTNNIFKYNCSIQLGLEEENVNLSSP